MQISKVCICVNCVRCGYLYIRAKIYIKSRNKLDTHSPGSHQSIGQHSSRKKVEWREHPLTKRGAGKRLFSACLPHTLAALSSLIPLTALNTGAADPLYGTARRTPQGVWLTPTVHKSRHDIKAAHRGCLQVTGRPEVRVRSQAGGAAISSSKREREGWMNGRTGGENVYHWPPPPPLKWNHCPS